jgi:hypothetical protein
VQLLILVVFAAFRRRATDQPLRTGGQREIGHRPVPGGVLLQAPAYEVGSFRVEDHGGGEGSVDRFAGVEVAQRRPEGGAAFFSFAQQAFHDFLGEVARVELSDLGQEAVEQSAARCLVDVLGTGHQFHAG